MELEQIKHVRKLLHHLPGEERSNLPLRVMCSTTNYWWDESTSCFIWDDSNEMLYVICGNSIQTSTTDSRLFPMCVIAVPYSDVTFIEAPLDRLSLDNFLKDCVDNGLTNDETRKRYFKDMTDLNDERTYFMGQPSPTTEKRTLHPDDEIINKDVQFL